MSRFAKLKQDLLYSAFEFVCKVLFKTVWPLTVSGLEHIPQNGPMIFAGNHAGLLDTPMLVMALNQHQQQFGRKVTFFMHDSVKDWPVVGCLVRHANVVIYEPGKELSALRQCLAILKSGGSICIFPEGKLSRDGSVGEFLPGAQWLAQKSGAPMVPFTITGGYEAWSWENRLRPQFGKIVLCLHPTAEQVRRAAA